MKHRICASAIALLSVSWAASAVLAQVSPELDSELRRVGEKIERAEQLLLPGRPVLEWPDLPPEPDSLSCGSPCASGTLSAGHPFYDVFLNCTNGAFTARTGPIHSVTINAGAPQNVIYGGAFGGPGTSDITLYVHDTATQYTNPTGGQACVFDPPDTVAEPASVGLEQEWSLSPTPGMDLVLRQEMVAFGSFEADSGVRLTLSVTNSPSSTLPATVGLRWQIDYQNASDDGPLYAAVTCDPPSTDPVLSVEHEMSPAEIKDFYRIQNNTGFPIFSNVTSTTSLSGIPNTATPDRLIFGVWSALRASVWNYVTNEGNTGVDADSAVLYYFGHQAADAPVLAPGESVTRTVVIFTSPDLVDCGDFVPGCAPSVTNLPGDRSICAGGMTTLDGSGLGLSNCDGPIDYQWRDDMGLVSTDPVVDVSPGSDTLYMLVATCSTDPSCTAEHQVLVTVELPPELDGATASDADPCNRGLKLGWTPARWHDPSASGVYNVYRSEISCADALTLAPLVLGLVDEAWFDGTVEPGVFYHYVIEAEDARLATECSPTGPNNGGAVDRFCMELVLDPVPPALPAGLGIVLFAAHDADELQLSWAGARALLPGEHFHLLKAWDDPTSTFAMVNGEGDLTRAHLEVDRSSELQFFDLRVANACEALSIDEFPPSR